MLASVIFPFEIGYIRPRGRKTISEAVLSETLVEFQEAAADAAPVAFTIEPPITTRAGGASRRIRRADPTPPTTIVTFRNRLFWPVFDGAGRPLQATRWLAELRKADGLHTLPPRHLTGRHHPDILKLGQALHGFRNGDWPTIDFAAIEARKIERSQQNQAITSIQSMAAKILVRNGEIFVEGGEPVYRVGCRAQNFGPCAERVEIDVVDLDTLNDREFKPFLDGEIFRYDRHQDACAFRDSNLEADPERRSWLMGDSHRIVAFGTFTTTTELALPQLDSLAMTLREHVMGDLECHHRKTPPRFDVVSASEVIRSAGPRYLLPMADFLAAAQPPASVDDHAALFENLLFQYQTVDTSEEAFGYLESLKIAMTRAIRRVQNELQSGLVTPQPMDEVDAAALSGLETH